MAKSKSGGTRSYLRGRIANDVYSIGKDSKGKKQQVVRSLAESVANPQTLAQMRGRMIMSTVMQAVSGLSQIIDHSFDNVPVGQPSISEFIRQNYKLVKEDVAAHPASNNAFALNEYQEKGIMPGEWKISQGDVITPAALTIDTADGFVFAVPLTEAANTAADVRSAMEVERISYITIVGMTYDADNGNVSNSKAVFVRLHPVNTLPGDTVITASNFLQLFELDNPFGLQVLPSTHGEGNATKLYLTILDSGSNPVGVPAVIVTDERSGAPRHSTAYMLNTEKSLSPAMQPADKVITTYPIGQAMFLNGGDL